MGDKVFALDIGTRTVVGLIVEFEDEKMRVLAAEIREHEERTMLDGQIHDVPQVARLVGEVKQALEQKTGSALTKVAVAAAGRALKTAKGAVTRGHSSLKEIDDNLVLTLEIDAVQEAQRNLVKKEQRLADYHCVGYSTVSYYLDGQPMGNLSGQFGSSVGVEIIATFLPRVVVDSLVNVVQRADLELSSLTLEPIAALNVIIPQNMRQLNIALVDVGAGTSDIAVTSQGSVTGYAMVPAAGDEITEVLCEQFLLDFHTGEQVKRCLNDETRTIEFHDVVGVSHELTAKEIVEAIRPVIYDLAQRIAQAIMEINQKAPQAVIAIGGGSQTPLLTQALAEKLSLTGSRVAVRGREALAIEGQEDVLTGPQAVTPIGIASSWRYNRALQFSDIRVNGRPVRLISGSGKGTVSDALLAAGINVRQLYGKPGLGKSLTLNGNIHFVKGALGQPAKVLINGKEAALDTPVASGSSITVEPGEKGKDAQVTVRSLVAKKYPPVEITINGAGYSIGPKVLVNEKEVDPDQEIMDKAVVNVFLPRTVKEVLQRLEIPYQGKEILMDGKAVDEHDQVFAGCSLELVSGSRRQPDTGVRLRVNGEDIVVNRENLIFTDLFNYINFNPSPPSGGSRLLMQVNGKAAQFTTPLQDGDNVVIRWEEVSSDGS